MDTNNQNRLIPLELTRDDLGWLRAFLDQERSAARKSRAFTLPWLGAQP